MSERWRDKKGEPGFTYLPWMDTVDELEDQIAGLVAALEEARHYVNGSFIPMWWQPIEKIDAAIAKAKAS